MISLESSSTASTPPPWGVWHLDSDFFAKLNDWTAKHPDKKGLRTVLKAISDAIDGSKDWPIPDSPFPAKSLVTALATLLKYGVKVTQAKHQVKAFVQEAVAWITQIADAFKDAVGGQFVAKAWDSLQEMRLIKDWYEDTLWERLTHAPDVESHIKDFKERLESTRVCFRTISAIHLAHGQDLILDHLSEMRSLITTLQRDNAANRDILVKQIQNQQQIVADILKEIRTWASEWTESSPRLLWLSGMPDPGKSVITTTGGPASPVDDDLMPSTPVRPRQKRTASPSSHGSSRKRMPERVANALNVVGSPEVHQRAIKMMEDDGEFSDNEEVRFWSRKDICLF
ncbi:hypothetical protein C8J57DRAFT_1240014 [Mycena rebaudengoi]|nr:hypothetical protein C8J57DRAFT_1240014 [Mycena rebaudengoi]